LRGVVFPSLHGTLDTLVVEVGVVFLLEALEHSLELVHPALGSVALTP
jgi:hypothetical protein